MPDGVTIACHTLGDGPVVLLLHGFLFNAQTNWFAPGLAQALAEAGFRVVAPDWRGHGDSDAPRDAHFYPPDALAIDVEQILSAMAIDQYALVGYSLGARMAARLVARGARPERLVLGGMGASGVTHVAKRQAHFEEMIRLGEASSNPEAGRLVQKFLHANHVNPDVAIHVLQSQCDTTPAALSAFTCPTLVLCGEHDHDNGSSAELAALIPGARHIITRGAHLSAFAKPDFRDALVAFLTESRG